MTEVSLLARKWHLKWANRFQDFIKTIVGQLNRRLEEIEQAVTQITIERLTRAVNSIPDRQSLERLLNAPNQNGLSGGSHDLDNILLEGNMVLSPNMYQRHWSGSQTDIPMYPSQYLTDLYNQISGPNAVFQNPMAPLENGNALSATLQTNRGDTAEEAQGGLGDRVAEPCNKTPAGNDRSERAASCSSGRRSRRSSISSGS